MMMLLEFNELHWLWIVLNEYENGLELGRQEILKKTQRDNASQPDSLHLFAYVLRHSCASWYNAIRYPAIFA